MCWNGAGVRRSSDTLGTVWDIDATILKSKNGHGANLAITGNGPMVNAVGELNYHNSSSALVWQAGDLLGDEWGEAARVSREEDEVSASRITIVNGQPLVVYFDSNASAFRCAYYE